MKKLSILFFCSLCVLAFTACGESTESSYSKGEEALQEEDYETAIEDFTAAIKADPDTIDAYLGRAKAYLEQGETEESLASAKSDYEKVLELDEGNVDGTLGMADIYIRESDADAARALLEEALEKTDGNEEIADKLAEFDSGQIYDSSRQLRKEAGYDKNGDMLWYHELTYDEEGRKASITSYDVDGNQSAHIDFEYLDDGRPKNSYRTASSSNVDAATLRSGNNPYSFVPGIVLETRHEYNDEENSVTTTDYNSDGTAGASYKEVHDEVTNNVIETYSYDADGTLSGYFTFEYDENGGYLGEHCYDGDGNLTRYTTQEQGEDEHTTIGKDYDGDGKLLSTLITEHDENGNTIKQSSYDENGNLDSYIVYKRDENGNKIGQEMYDGDGNLKDSFSYE